MRTQTAEPVGWGTRFSQLGRFAGVGMVATGWQYVVLLGLVRTTTIGAAAASTIGFGTSALLNYYLNYEYTFRSRRNHVRAMLTFGIVAGVGALLNFALMAAAVDRLHVHYVAAQIATTGAVTLWSFIAHRTWTFGANRVH